jgi:hypothetical protein
MQAVRMTCGIARALRLRSVKSGVDDNLSNKHLARMVAEAPKVIPMKGQPRQTDVRDLAMIRTLYLVQGLQPSDIERMGIGFTANQVSQMAHREGWTGLRKKALAKGEESARASAEAAVSRVSEAIAIESEELCFKALTQTRSGLDKGGLEGAKQAQAASSTLRNLAGVAKMLREPANGSGDMDRPNMNLFFVGVAGPVQAQSEPKRVTELDAKPVQ